MVRRTSLANWATGHSGAVDSCALDIDTGNLATVASGEPGGRRQCACCDDAPCTDSLPWRLIHVAALTGLVALWLCGG